MEKRRLLCLLLVAGAVLLALLAACGGEQGPAPPGELGGEDLLQARCTRCHSLDRVQSAAKTLADWEHEVEHMRELGAQLTDAEDQILVEYLAETYGP